MPRLQKTWIVPTLYFRALEGPLKFGFLRVYACFCVFIRVYACFNSDWLSPNTLAPQISISAACAVVGLVASANLLFLFPYKATFFSPLLSLVY
ncbi:hypothetical protein BDR26DRAFT_858969 [Obelidium mucronatum]|nr:hypothetical protein BDR26DRAFT_858969 [Obelidium mucronatum]